MRPPHLTGQSSSESPWRGPGTVTDMDYGFSNWKTVTPECPELPVLPVRLGMAEQVRVTCGTPSDVLVSVSGQGRVTVELELPDELEAPVEEGERVGKLCVLLDGAVVEELPVTAGETVQKVTFRSAFLYLLRHFFCGREAPAV